MTGDPGSTTLSEPPLGLYDAGVWRLRWPNPSAMPELVPGVRGVSAEHDGYLWVGSILCETPGQGMVGAYLDSLPVRAAFPSVISERLAGMLARRGFRHRPHLFWSTRYREWVDGWVRP